MSSSFLAHSTRAALLAAAALASITSCGPSDNGGGGTDSDVAECDSGFRCSDRTLEACQNGHWQAMTVCAGGCLDTQGCVPCQPGTNFCQDGDVYACNDQGQPGGVVEACTGVNLCSEATVSCTDACAAAETDKSYQGCEYFAVDLDNAEEVDDVAGGPNCFDGSVTRSVRACVNAGNTATAGKCDPPTEICPAGFTCKTQNVCEFDAQHSPFAIVVSNPQNRPVDVTITGPDASTHTQTIASGAVVAIKPADLGIADQSIEDSGIQHKAYKISSTLPIVAYQFNPLDNVNVFSNDASLLIPRTTFDTEYYAMTKPTLTRRPDADNFNGYMTIVAWQDDTEIQVTTTANTVAGNGTAAITAGTPTSFTLNAFDVLNLEAVADGDLTGSKVVSTNAKTFGAFAGHDATNFGETTPPDGTHTSGPCCADHLEEMLFPTSTWGKTFAIARSQVRAGDKDVIRVMAQKAGTSVTFSPAPTGSCTTLGPGQFCEVKITADTTITATEPVLVGHYLESAIWGGFFDSVGEGDPSLAIAVPTEQFRRDYKILVPQAYDKNFVSIATPTIGSVTLDGTDVSGVLTAFGGDFRGGRIQVGTGQHTILCSNGCSVEVYGYSSAVSYMFAGGLNLNQIVIE